MDYWDFFAVPAMFLVMGILYLVTGIRGRVLRQREFLTIGRDPLPPEPMTARQRKMWFWLGIFMIVFSVAGLSRGVYRIWHPR